MLKIVGLLVVGIICAVTCLFPARVFLKRLKRRSTRRLARQVRAHLHRKRVLRTARQAVT